MEVIINFCQSLKDQILNYYHNTYKYIEDLLVYKEVDLNATILDKTQEEIKIIVETMVKVTKVSLKTIGVPEDQIKVYGANFDEIPNKEGVDYISIEDYYNDIKVILNKFLLNSVIDYLLDIDQNQLNTAELFNLLPNQLKGKIEEFKALNFNILNIKNEIRSIKANLENVIDISTLDITKQQDLREFIKNKTISPPIENLVNELEDFKQERLKILSAPPASNDNRITTSPQDKIFVFKNAEMKGNNVSKEAMTLKTITIGKKDDDIPTPEEIIITEIREPPQNFLDYYGKFPTIEKNVLNALNINSVNLINSRIANPSEFLDLETLFYYISILKMIGIGFPFSSIEIVEVAKNYINNQIFSSSKTEPSDPYHVLYGIALFSELNILNRKDIINIAQIKDYLETELDFFIPEKLSLNFYVLLSLRLLERRGVKIKEYIDKLDNIEHLNLSNLDEFDPISDIFHQLATIKLYESKGKQIPTLFKENYSKQLNSLIEKNGSINNNITDTAKMLLIIYMLDLQKKEKKTCDKLIKFITDNVVFFDSRSIDQNFSWKEHKLAYIVELRMLFWTLLALSQFPNYF